MKLQMQLLPVPLILLFTASAHAQLAAPPPPAIQAQGTQSTVTTQPRLSGTQTQPPPSDTRTIRIEPIGPVKLESGGGPPWWSYFVQLGAAVLTLLGVWAGLSIGQRNTRQNIDSSERNNNASIWQKANETEQKDIQSKLDGFYIPFRLLSDSNHQFAQDLRAREHQKGRKDYRMLPSLFDKDWRTNLSDWDKTIVEIVANNGEDLRALIATKSGLVDEKILPYLSRASVHFRVLHLAYKDTLGSDPSPFKDYVYPRQLDEVLTLEVDRLRARIAQLRAKPSEDPGSIPPLTIPKRLELKSWVDPDGRLIEPTTS